MLENGARLVQSAIDALDFAKEIQAVVFWNMLYGLTQVYSQEIQISWLMNFLFVKEKKSQKLWEEKNILAL